MSAARRARVLNKLGNEWMVLLSSLILAFSVWFIHGMSLKYMVPMKFKVTIDTDLEGYAGESASDDVLVLRATGTGFKIVGLRRSANVARSVRLKVPGSKVQRVSGETNVFEVATRDLTEELYQALGNGITINSFDTERLTFRLTPRIHKKVPVVIQQDISCKSQYMIASDIALRPDSVAVYGDVSILDNISQVETEKVTFTGADAPLDGKVRIKPVRGAELSATETEYHIDVVRYIEITSEVEFTLVGKPAGVNMMIIPSSGTVRYRVPYALAEGASQENPPVFVVYYRDFAASRSGMVVPTLYRAPAQMISYELEPAAVECAVLEL
ncbi:MAG: hypothetical protein J5693_02245 [Bacteroidales bacterium]|nr:hypothetical protein [Bacteroidales bacterium]